jgi:hypothetical protein
MKRDMGGAAGILGAFRTVCLGKASPHRVCAVLCLAENSVGPLSVRPDDVIVLYSGKSVRPARACVPCVWRWCLWWWSGCVCRVRARAVCARAVSAWNAAGLHVAVVACAFPSLARWR